MQTFFFPFKHLQSMKYSSQLIIIILIMSTGTHADLTVHNRSSKQKQEISWEKLRYTCSKNTEKTGRKTVSRHLRYVTGQFKILNNVLKIFSGLKGTVSFNSFKVQLFKRLLFLKQRYPTFKSSFCRWLKCCFFNFLANLPTLYARSYSGGIALLDSMVKLEELNETN